MVNEIGTQNVHLKSEGLDWWIKNICAQKEFNYMSISIVVLLQHTYIGENCKLQCKTLQHVQYLIQTQPKITVWTSYSKVVHTHLPCRTRTLRIRSECPEEYCSITSFTSYGFMESLNLCRARSMSN